MHKATFYRSALVVGIASLLVVSVVIGATTIGSNISTDGTLSATGLATFGAVTSTSATSTAYVMVGPSLNTMPSGFDFTGDLFVSSDGLFGNKVTSTVALWVGTNGTANNLDMAGGDAYVQGSLEVDSTSFFSGAAVFSSTVSTTGATTTNFIVIGGPNGRLSRTFDYTGDLWVSDTVEIGGNSTTSGQRIVFGGDSSTATTTVKIKADAVAGNGTSCIEMIDVEGARRAVYVDGAGSLAVSAGACD